MREQFAQAMKDALKQKNQRKLGTVRLINAAIKDRDIAARGEGKDPISDHEILQLLQKMVKQREESSRLYEEGGRCELASQELEEIEIIKEFLPEPMTEAETIAAIDEILAELNASSLKDIGKVMGILKDRFAGRLDFGSASGLVKKRLAS